MLMTGSEFSAIKEKFNWSRLYLGELLGASPHCIGNWLKVGLGQTKRSSRAAEVLHAHVLALPKEELRRDPIPVAPPPILLPQSALPEQPSLNRSAVSLARSHVDLAAVWRSMQEVQEPQTAEQLARLLGVSDWTVHGIMREGEAKGLVTRIGRGRSYHPFRYILTEKLNTLDLEPVKVEEATVSAPTAPQLVILDKEQFKGLLFGLENLTASLDDLVEAWKTGK